MKQQLKDPRAPPVTLTLRYKASSRIALRDVQRQHEKKKREKFERPATFVQRATTINAEDATASNRSIRK